MREQAGKKVLNDASPFFERYFGPSAKNSLVSPRFGIGMRAMPFSASESVGIFTRGVAVASSKAFTQSSIVRVILRSAKKQMGGIAASAIVTGVTSQQFSGIDSRGDISTNARSGDMESVMDAKVAVSRRPDISGPPPTIAVGTLSRSLINLRPKSLNVLRVKLRQFTMRSTHSLKVPFRLCVGSVRRVNAVLTRYVFDSTTNGLTSSRKLLTALA